MESGRLAQIGLGVILAFAAVLAAGSVAPVQAAVDVTSDNSCVPSSIRPGEDALVTCTLTIANGGDETAVNVTQEVTNADSLAPPSLSIYTRTIDGQPVRVRSGSGVQDLTSPAAGGLVQEFGNLAPGQTVEVVSEIIFNVGEGPHGGLINISVSGEVVTSSLLEIHGDPDSLYPPTNLTVTKTLLSLPGDAPVPGPVSPPDGITDPGPISPLQFAPELRPPPTLAPLSHDLPGPISPPDEPEPERPPVEYEIVVRNDSDVSFAAVTLRDKHSNGVDLSFAEPDPVEVNDTTSIVRWDLGPLGPGEEARVRLDLTGLAGCFSSENAAVATVLGPDGEEHYVDFSDQIAPCGGQGGGGPEDDSASPLVLPSTGSDIQNVAIGWAWQVAAVALTVAAALGFVAYRLIKPRP